MRACSVTWNVRELHKTKWGTRDDERMGEEGRGKIMIYASLFALSLDIKEKRVAYLFPAYIFRTCKYF